MHLYGVGEALKVMFVITAVAVAALWPPWWGMIPKFYAANLLDIDADGSLMSGTFLPFGIAGVLSAFVYGIWFFLAVEGVPLAAEEAADPARDMPRGIIVADPGAGGLRRPDARARAGRRGVRRGRATPTTRCRPRCAPSTASDIVLASVVNYAGLAGLVASFFSIIYAYSRQLFALSRAGYLPRVLSLTAGATRPGSRCWCPAPSASCWPR